MGRASAVIQSRLQSNGSLPRRCLVGVASLVGLSSQAITVATLLAAQREAITPASNPALVRLMLAVHAVEYPPYIHYRNLRLVGFRSQYVVKHPSQRQLEWMAIQASRALSQPNEPSHLGLLTKFLLSAWLTDSPFRWRIVLIPRVLEVKSCLPPRQSEVLSTYWRRRKSCYRDRENDPL